MDDLVREADPAVLRQDAHQFLLNFLRRIAFGKAETAGDAEDVRIYHDSLRFAEADAEDDIGCFAGRAGDGDEFGKSFGHLAAELGNHLASRALNRLGLVVKEAGGADEGFQIFQAAAHHLLWRRKAAEELRGHHVHAHVGALRREDCGDQQFPRRAVRQGALDAGIGFV